MFFRRPEVWFFFFNFFLIFFFDIYHKGSAGIKGTNCWMESQKSIDYYH